MKLAYSVLLVGAVLVGKAYGQTAKKDSTKRDKDAPVKDLVKEAKAGGINDIIDFYNRVGTANDKQTFANVLTAVAQFSGITSNSVSVKAKLLQITSIWHQYQNSADYYSTHAFARNFEIDLSGTPNNNNVNQYSKASGGFTYAILNNNYLREDDYKAFSKFTSVSIADKTTDALTNIINQHPQFEFDIRNFMENPKRKNKDLPKQVLDLLSQQNITDPAANLTASETAFKEYLVKAKARPLLTISPTSDYDGTHGWFSDYGAKGNLTLYAFVCKKWKLPWSFSLQPSYLISKDTLANTVFKNRKVFGASISVDISPIVDPSTYTAILDIKPQVGYIRTNGELFSTEKADQFSFMTTVTYTVSKTFAIPLAFQVTRKNPTLFGFLSIQYSL